MLCPAITPGLCCWRVLGWMFGFFVIDPIGNSVYIYSDREPAEEFRQYFKG